MPYEEILENIKTRDKNDMEKEIGALKKQMMQFILTQLI